jgi:hypothetical protein
MSEIARPVCRYSHGRDVVPGGVIERSLHRPDSRRRQSAAVIVSGVVVGRAESADLLIAPVVPRIGYDDARACWGLSLDACAGGRTNSDQREAPISSVLISVTNTPE